MSPAIHTVARGRGRWFVDETYVKVAGKWRYVYRAVDQYGQIIDVLVSARRDLRAAQRFFAGAMRGLKRDHSARVIIRGHALMQNLRHGHDELGIDARAPARRARVHRTRPNDLNPKRKGRSVPRGPTRINATVPYQSPTEHPQVSRLAP